MEYSVDVFHTFLGLYGVIYLAVNGTVTSLSVFIKHILNCVPKMNKAFTSLEWHAGKVIKDNIFGWSIPLMCPWLIKLYFFQTTNLIELKLLNGSVNN